MQHLDGDNLPDTLDPDPDQILIELICLPNVQLVGMAQTAMGASGWYGEDCLAGSVCHPYPGGWLVLDRVGAIADIVAGQTTLMQVQYPTVSTPPLTYVAVDTNNCYTWGHDPSYYPGCIEIGSTLY